MTRRSRPGVERTDSYNALGLLNKGTLARASVTSGDGVSAVLSRRPSYAPSRDEGTDDSSNNTSQESLRDIEPELAIRFEVQSEVQSLSSLDELLLPVGIADYTFVKEDAGGLLGRGKFSAVWVARKGEKEVAIKHTPLFRHHPLIASRLLREPTILAQLPAHRNLIKVSEMIRTPGHFYLVEEYFPNYINLEDFVAQRCPQGKLSESQAFAVLYQLVDVVRSALHRPIFIAHRDIKPENILIHPKTLHILILDFGLATHFSGSEPRLTTCCGSPAFHSPELWLSLKSPPGSVRYWGPEIDVWCIGVSMLRCLVGKRCPLGTSHSSLQDLSNKAVDTLLAIPYQGLRHIVASFLDMDGEKRIQHFKTFEIPASPKACAEVPLTPREFKSTTFVPTTAKHSLYLPIELSSPATTRTRALSGSGISRPMSRSTSRDVTSPKSSSSCSVSLVNPDQQPATSVVSFIKYALRCAGILYHVLPDTQATASFSAMPTPEVTTSIENEMDSFSAAFQQPRLAFRPIYLHCVMTVPSSTPTSADQHKRPGLFRAYTAGTRPLSMPPATDRNAKANAGSSKDKKIDCLQFWMSMVLEEDTSRGAKSRRKKRTAQKNDFASIIPSRITIKVSDKRAFGVVHSALELGKSVSSRHNSPSSGTVSLQDPDRGRSTQRRGVSSNGDTTPSDTPTSLSEPPVRGKSMDALNLYSSSTKDEEAEKPTTMSGLLESARRGIGSISRSASKLRISDMGQEEEDDDDQLSMRQKKDQQAQYQAAVFM